MIKIEVTTIVTGLNYNWNVFFFSFFINRNITINAYLLYKNPIKTILKMSYNTYTGVDTALKEVSKQNLSVVMLVWSNFPM